MIDRQRKKSPGVDKVINGKVYRLPSRGDKVRQVSASFAPPSAEEVKSASDKRLCFFLGLLLGPFGMLLSAIIAKADGVVASIKGVCISVVVVALILLLCNAH